MIRNFLTTAWRNAYRYRSYSLINVLGLALGIASCLFIFLVVQYELSYDLFNSKAKRTYRVTLHALDYNPCVSMAVVPALRNDFPELEQVCQVWYRQSALLTVASRKFDEKRVLYADQNLPSVFDYQWLQGDPKTALAEPNTAVLTSSQARKYFGDQNPMGQTLNLDNRYDLKVTGLIKDLPGNTHLPFDMMVSFATVAGDVKNMMSQFYAIPSGSFAYIVLPQSMPASGIGRRIKSFIEKNWGASIAREATLNLQPLTDIHFDDRYLNNTISYTTSRQTYYALAAIAVLIIIIACINFINLATAQAIKRAKEVGVRKVLGATRLQLIARFLGETTLMVALALVIGLAVVALSLPQLAGWFNLVLTFQQLLQPSLVLTLSGILLTVILVAGMYPAFIQSSFQPITSLRSKPDLHIAGFPLRKSLVVVQFAICQAMIIGTLVIAYQMDFFQNRDLGFNKNAVISFGIPDQGKTEALRQELAANPGVSDISFSSGAPGINNMFTNFIAPDAGIFKDGVTEVKFVDESFSSMFDLKLLAGQKIKQTATSPNDTIYTGAVNQAMIQKLGISDPQQAIGKQVVVNGNWHVNITGVLQDIQTESKHKKIRPAVLIYRPDLFYMASVRLKGSNVRQVIENIDKQWAALFPQNVFSYEFLDDHIAAWYRQEQKEYRAFKLFSGIAILIGCLGLYGLVALAAAQRTREVSIRKILGASAPDIVLLFSREFVLLIVIAFALAAPAAYYFMNGWLQGFAYKISIGPGIFIIAILSSFAIAGCTIAWQSIKAAIANPAKSLRSE